MGPGSAASTASENSLPSTPPVLIARAMTPAKGPRPTATDEEHADHEIGHRAHGVEHPAHRLHDPERRDVARREQSGRYGDDDGQEGAPQRHLDGQPHRLGVAGPVRPVGLGEVGAVGAHVFGVGEQLGEPLHLDGPEGDHKDERDPAPEQDVEHAVTERAGRRRRRRDGRGCRGGGRSHFAAGAVGWVVGCAPAATFSFWILASSASAALMSAALWALRASVRCSVASISRTGSRKESSAG